jgi:hypothetical protein
MFDPASETPFSPGRYFVSRDVEDDIVSGKYIGMFDLIGSKGAPSAVKVNVVTILEQIECRYERTGDDAFVFVADKLQQALQTIEAVRIRTLQFVGQGSYRGLRASIIRGDCIIRRFAHDQSRLIMITDRPGEPDIPFTAYLLDQIKKLLSGPDRQDKLVVDDESRGVALDRDTAIELGKSDDLPELESRQIYRLGRWQHKGLSRDAFFYIPPT